MDPQWYPVILDPLPDLLKLTVTRKLGQDFRSITKIKEYIKSEVEAIDNYNYVIEKKQYDDDGGGGNESKFTTYSLTSPESKRSKNMYIGCKTYYMKKYQNVADIVTGKKIFTWWEKMF